MVTRISNVFRRPTADKRLWLQTWMLLGLVVVRLRTHRFSQVKSLMPAIYQRMFPIRNHNFSPERIRWAVSSAGRFVPRASCLPQAIITEFLLNWYGYPADLRIGVIKNENGQLEAHAWVETGGRVAIGWLPDLVCYTALPAMEETL